MMPCGLIWMARCRGVVFRACTRCGHVSSDLAMLVAESWTKREFYPVRLRRWQARKLLRRRDPDPDHARLVELGSSAAFQALRWPNSPLQRALSSAAESQVYDTVL
jgi:hypothetical protein